MKQIETGIWYGFKYKWFLGVSTLQNFSVPGWLLNYCEFANDGFSMVLIGTVQTGTM